MAFYNDCKKGENDNHHQLKHLIRYFPFFSQDNEKIKSMISVFILIYTLNIIN